ncbi:MAG TPA: TIGR02147 family protein [Pseudobdellovibrionaceae bacterium]|nr:TIGR02147 family protein [Pseudobdellovibrionaceae bacterium]
MNTDVPANQQQIPQQNLGEGQQVVSSQSADPMQPPRLSDFMNYRTFLANFYEYKRELTKKSVRRYNYAVFSAAADIKSPNYLKMIIEGKRNLSDEMIGRFAKALGFNKEQGEEFYSLVQFTQAMDPAERNLHLKKLSEIRVGMQLKSGNIDRKTWEKVPNWIAWIIYAMVDQEGVVFTSDQLRILLRGKAAEAEIEEALNGLLASGELVRDPESGTLKKAHHLIESPEDVPVALVRKLQSQLMYLGLESIYQDAATEREFGTLTLSLNKDEFEEIKFKLRQMRKSIHKDNSIARTKSKGERVYQLNIQLFPVTNPSQMKEKTPEQIEAQKAALKESLMNAQRQADLARAAINELDKTPDAKQNVGNLAANAAHFVDLLK